VAGLSILRSIGQGVAGLVARIRARSGAEHRTMPQTGPVRAWAVVYGGNIVWCDQADVTKAPTQQSHDEHNYRKPPPSGGAAARVWRTLFCVPQNFRGRLYQSSGLSLREGGLPVRTMAKSSSLVKGSYFGGWLH